MRRFIIALLPLLFLLPGCSSPPALEAEAVWSIEPVDPVEDQWRFQGLDPMQAGNYRLVKYDFTITNKGGLAAEWVGIRPEHHPDFAARKLQRFDLTDDPPLHHFRPGRPWRMTAFYFVEGTETELAALAPQNRFRVTWKYKGQQYSVDAVIRPR